ncbi:MAG: long-chain fatty acid--CoA ligase [Deferrisomatales bacterium]
MHGKWMNPAWWVHRWAELRPDKAALVWGDAPVGYADLAERMEQCARWLDSAGVGPGDRVGALLRNGPEFLELYLACARIGAVFVPLNFRCEAPELDYFLADCEPGVLVVDERFLPTVAAMGWPAAHEELVVAAVGAGERGPGVRDYRGEIHQARGRTAPAFPGDPEAPQMIMYTSGTTGRPKGALLPYRKTFFNCLNAVEFFSLRSSDVVLIVLPLFHSGGLLIQASPALYAGATAVLHERFDPARVRADLGRYGVTQFLGVPTVYRRLVAEGVAGELARLTTCAIGGERTEPELVRDLLGRGVRLVELMGQTETSIFLRASPEDLAQAPDTVGRPVFHAEVALVDPQGRKVPSGDTGEIAVRGPIVMSGYWRDPEKTRRAVRDGWLHTGDLARRDREGRYYLLDRLHDMYISGGENVYPAEVEAVLRRHPQVADVAVVGEADPQWGQVGHAFVVPREGGRLDGASVIEFCRGRLARYKWPRQVTLCRDLPRTAVGKVRKRDLLERARGGGQGDAP